MRSTVIQLTPILTKRLSLGALALLLAGIIALPTGILTANVPTDPAQNLAFAVGANSLSYRLSLMLGFFSAALEILGLFALYAFLAHTDQERLAFVGLVISVGLFILFLPLTGFGAFIVPAIGSLVQQGQPEMVAVMDQFIQEPFIVVSFLSGILLHFGVILIGVAIWRSGALWKWGGLLLLMTGVLGIPEFLDVKVLQIINPLLRGLALIAIGLSLRQAVQAASQLLAPMSTSHVE